MSIFLKPVALGFMISALFVSLFVSPAFAGTIDLTPLAESIITAFAVVATIGGSVVVRYLVGFLAKKTKLADSQFEDLAVDRINDILQKSIAYAEMYMKQKIADPESPIRSIKIDNFFVELAANYALKSMPDLIKHFNLTPARIKQMIEARLNDIVPMPKPDSKEISTV